jgi:HAD superfamily hydrolase (TIGR01509 family)
MGTPTDMSSQASSKIDTVVLDVDGTLVDTVYQHAVFWAQAFDKVGVDVPTWKLHRAIGMGGDRLITEVAGEDVEKQHGDEVRAGHDERFGEVIDDIRPLPGAADLLDALRDRGFKVALASSGIEEQTKRLIAHFGGEERSDAWTSSDDADASKPAPDLIQIAIDKVGGEHALVIGDAVWDITAAEKAGLPSIGLRCGGFSAAELHDAGASDVFTDPQDLLDHLDETELAT